MSAYLSSIFSSETLRGVSWRVPRGALGAVAIVAACELCLHAASRWLPDPVLWGSKEVSAKVEQAGRRAAGGVPPVDLLILGPSHASVGLSPRDMGARAAGGSVSIYNGALNGRTYP